MSSILDEFGQPIRAHYTPTPDRATQAAWAKELIDSVSNEDMLRAFVGSGLVDMHGRQLPGTGVAVSSRAIRFPFRVERA